jgi:hypothetical protein
VGKLRNAYKSLIGKLEGDRSSRRPRSRSEDNIKIVLKEIEYEGVD